MPAPQVNRLDVVAVYQVRLRALRSTARAIGCYEAVLLDSALGSLWGPLCPTCSPMHNVTEHAVADAAERLRRQGIEPAF